MTTYLYPTPAWLEASAKSYHSSPRFEDELRKVTTRIYMRIKSDPTWGIDGDLIFGAVVEKGALQEMGFCNEEEAKSKAEFILAATPQEWKKILTKESKFLTDFMLGKIQLEQGSKVGMLGIAPYANLFVEALTQVELKFPDDMTPQEREGFCNELAKIRIEHRI